MTDLLNCPFCGSESVSQDSTPCTDEADYIWFKCDGCGVESEGEHGRDAALAQWNRRPHAPVSRPGDGVEGESVAIMRPFWVSWWGEPGTFELHRPWWVSGERDDGKKSICAAVLAQDEFTARLSVQWAHDDNDAVIEWRFAEEKPKGWSPFGSRFPQADWMIWPEMAALTPPAEPVSRPAGEREEMDTALEAWLTARGLLPRGEWDWPGVVAMLDHHEEALLSPAAPDAGGGWMPIETAPHEKLCVLGWLEGGVWKQEIDVASAGQRWPNGYSNRWFHGQATHWMRLPAPPTPQPGGDR